MAALGDTYVLVSRSKLAASDAEWLLVRAVRPAGSTSEARRRFTEYLGRILRQSGAEAGGRGTQYAVARLGLVRIIDVIDL